MTETKYSEGSAYSVHQVQGTVNCFESDITIGQEAELFFDKCKDCLQHTMRIATTEVNPNLVQPRGVLLSI